MRCLDDLGVWQVEDVDAVDGEDDVTDLEARGLRGRRGLDGRDHDRTGTVNAETKLPVNTLDADGLVALCKKNIIIRTVNNYSWSKMGTVHNFQVSSIMYCFY